MNTPDKRPSGTLLISGHLGHSKHLFCINQEKSVTNLSLEKKTLPTIRLKAPFTLMTTGAFSQNAKYFSELKFHFV